MPRRSEALAVRWANVDLDAGRVRIVDTIVDTPEGLAFAPPKTKQSVRQVPIPAFAVERLRIHKADQARRRLVLGKDWHDHDLVCDHGDGRPLDPMSFTHAFARIADEVGLGKVRLHDLRHAIGTSLAKSGTPLTVTSRLLGHTSTAFTAETYQHADEEMIDRAAGGWRMRSERDARLPFAFRLRRVMPDTRHIAKLQVRWYAPRDSNPEPND